MKTKCWMLVVMMAVIAGFIGGTASNSLLTIQANQNKSTGSKEGFIVVPAGGLIFKTPEGRVLARMDADPVGGRFGVYHVSGEPSAIMAAAPDGGVFAIYNKDGKPTGSMATDAGHGVIGLFDGKDKVIWEKP